MNETKILVRLTKFIPQDHNESKINYTIITTIIQGAELILTIFNKNINQGAHSLLF